MQGKGVGLLNDSATVSGAWVGGRSRRSADLAAALLLVDRGCVVSDVRLELLPVSRAENGFAVAASRGHAELTAWLRAHDRAQERTRVVELPSGWVSRQLAGLPDSSSPVL